MASLSESKELIHVAMLVPSLSQERQLSGRNPGKARYAIGKRILYSMKEAKVRAQAKSISGVRVNFLGLASHSFDLEFSFPMRRSVVVL